MSKGQKNSLIIFIFLAVVVDILILRTVNYSVTSPKTFTTGSQRYVLVTGPTDAVKLTTASSDGYYRIESGGAEIEGKHLTGEFFENKDGFLPTGKWIIAAGGWVTFTVSPTVPITVSLVSTVAWILVVIIISMMIVALLTLFAFSVLQ